MQDEDIDLRAWGVLIFLSIIWGSSFILMKKALIAFDPIDLACMRVTISAVSLIPFLIYYRKEIPWERWKKFIAVGVAGNGLPAILFFVAQTKISSSLSGLLNSLTPIWTMIVGIIFYSILIGRSQVIGVILGFIGTALLIIYGDGAGMDGDIVYGLLIVLATLSYGISGNLVKTYFQDTRSIVISAGSFIAIGIPASIYIIATGVWDVDISSSDIRYSLGAVAILSIVGTVMATIIFYKLVQKTSAVFASSVAYLMPIVALGWGFMDGEKVSWIHAVGIFLILLGVYLIRRKK